MKKIISFFVILLFLGIVPALSCIIEFEPIEVKLKKGETTTVILHLKYEHRKCEITLDDTEYETKGIKIIEMGKWVKIKKGDFSRKIKIKLTADKGTLKIIRECTKKGISEGELKVKAEK